jgi:hypothetical protein
MFFVVVAEMTAEQQNALLKHLLGKGKSFLPEVCRMNIGNKSLMNGNINPFKIGGEAWPLTFL